MRILEELGYVFVYMATTTAKSGSVRYYRLQTLLSSGVASQNDEPPSPTVSANQMPSRQNSFSLLGKSGKEKEGQVDQGAEYKVDNTHGTVFFDIGLLEDPDALPIPGAQSRGLPIMVVVSSKNLLVFQYNFKENSFVNIANINLPKGLDGSQTHGIWYLGQTVYLGIGSKFYYFNNNPVLNEINPKMSSTGAALTIFPIQDHILLCFEETAFFIGNEGSEAAPEFQLNLKFIGHANSFSLFGNKLIVYCKHHIEIWDLSNGHFIQILKTFNVKCVNPKNHLLQMTWTNSYMQIPFLCSLVSS